MNNELVFSSGSKVLTNSVLVAKKFGKEHKHVLESIRKIMTAENSAVLGMFEESNYLNEQNKKQPMFIMNRDGFTLLAMGFTGKQAMDFKLDYIGAFNKMEATIKNNQVAALPDFTNPAEAARAWAEQFEQKQIEAKRADEAEKQVLMLTPKAAFCDAVAASKTSCLIGELAKILRQNGVNTGEKRLFEWLRNNGYLGKHGERYNIPNQEYIERGYFELKKGTRSGNGGVLHTTITTKVTTKGQIYFTNLFLKKSIAL
jgi:anti-repressor protein